MHKQHKKDLPHVSNFRQVWRNPYHFLAFGFGTGLLPKAPGTWGTVIAIPIYMLVMHFPFWLYFAFTIAFTVLSMIICEITEKDLGIHDHPAENIDEIAGYLVTMLFAPVGPFWIILGFILFRIFDVWKPWPIAWIDRRVKGGFGTVLDDVLAACYSAALMFLIATLFYYYE